MDRGHPSAADDADASPAGAVVGPPVREEILDDRVEQFLGRIPGLLEVIVDLRGVDRGDGGVGVGVGGEQRALRRWRQRPGFGQELHPVQIRHPLIGQDHRDRLRVLAFVPEHVQPFGAALRADHSIVTAILGDKVTADRAQHLRVIVHGEDERLDHEVIAMIARGYRLRRARMVGKSAWPVRSSVDPVMRRPTGARGPVIPSAVTPARPTLSRSAACQERVGNLRHAATRAQLSRPRRNHAQVSGDCVLSRSSVSRRACQPARLCIENHSADRS